MTNDILEEKEALLKDIKAENDSAAQFLKDLNEKMEEADQEFVTNMLESDEKILDAVSK